MSVSEKTIAEGIRKGDNRAMRVFYDTFGAYLTAVCSRYIADDNDVSDILQESFLSIITNIDSFIYKGEGSLRAWTSRIVINQALSFLRKRQRESMLFVENEDFSDHDATYSPLEPPETDDIPPDVITEMIRLLPDGYRMVFNLYVIEGKSHKEISEILGIKESTSASQLHRAKALLLKKIRKYKNPS